MLMTSEQFQTEFLGHAKMPAKEPDLIYVLDDYVSTRKKTLQKATKLGVGKTGLEEIRAKAHHAFIKRWMMMKFASIDLSFIEQRKWWIKAERDLEGDAKVTEAYDKDPLEDVDESQVLVGCINRFFKADMKLRDFAFDDISELKEGATQELGQFQPCRIAGRSLRRESANVHALLPDGVGDRHVNIARNALSHYCLAEALLYAKGIDLDEEKSGERNRWREDDHVVSIIWAPNVDVLTIRREAIRPKGDPAIVLTMHDHSFLLDFYDTPNEASIENMIREFSEGKIRR